MKVLTLSSNYEPLGVVDWEKAMTLLFSGKVKTLSEYEETVRSPNLEFKIPSVIVFNHTKAKRINSVRFSRKNIWIRDEGRCQYCLKYVSSKDFTLDHVMPRKDGGKTTWSNVVTCCSNCNQKKADKPLAKCGMKLFRDPSKPRSLPYVQDVDFFYNFQHHIPESWKFWLGEEYR